jgi:hypothetical protein
VHALTLIRPDVQDTVIEKMDKDIRSMGFSYNRLTTGKHHQMVFSGPLSSATAPTSVVPRGWPRKILKLERKMTLRHSAE